MKLTGLDREIFEAVRSGNQGKITALLARPHGQYALAKFNEAGESLLSIAIGSWNMAIATLLLNHPSNMCLLVLEPATLGASDPKAMIGDHFTMDASWSDIYWRILERNDEDKSYVQGEFDAVTSAAAAFVAPPPLPASMYSAKSGGGYGEASASGSGAGGFGGGYGVARGSFEIDREMALRLQRDEEDLLAGFRAAEAIAAATEAPDEASLRLARELDNERIAAEYAKQLAEEEAQAEAVNDGAFAAWVAAGNDGPMPDGWGEGGVAYAAAVPAPLAFVAHAPRAGGAVGVAGGDVVNKVKTQKVAAWYEEFCAAARAAWKASNSLDENKTSFYEEFCHLPIDEIVGDEPLLGQLDKAWRAMYEGDPAE